MIKNTQMSNPGLLKELAKDLGISTNSQAANGEDFAQDLANYMSALIQIVGRNDTNDIASCPQLFEDEVKKEAHSLGLTLKFAGENDNNTEKSLVISRNFGCKAVKLFIKSIEGAVK